MNDAPDEAGRGPASPAELPYARGHSFATLDEYLSYLERANGPIDLPWYREVRPGVYELQTSMRPPPEPSTVTRAELLERYGFER